MSARPAQAAAGARLVACPAPCACSRANSFRHAANGIIFVIRNEPNMRVHLALAAIVVLVGLWIGLDLTAHCCDRGCPRA